MINQKVIALTTPGAYQLQINESTPITIDAYVWGGGGGGGASSDASYTAYGTGGSYAHYTFTVSPTDIIKIAVGGGGQGGRITNGSPTAPYGSVTGVYGGGSLAGYGGGPSGGLNQVPKSGNFGTGGGGGGASVITVNNLPRVVAAGGGGGGGGFNGYNVADFYGQTFTYTRSGEASDSNFSYFNGMIYGTLGLQSASGGGCGGGLTDSYTRLNGSYYPPRDLIGGGRNEREYGQNVSQGSVGYGGSIGYSFTPYSPTTNIFGPVGTSVYLNQFYPGGLYGTGGRAGLPGKPGSNGNPGVVILVLTQNGGTGVKVNGAWKDLENAYYKVNDEWRDIQKIYYKENGAWKKVFGDIETTLVSLPSEYILLEPQFVSPGALPAPIPGPQITLPTSLTFNVNDNEETDFTTAFYLGNPGDQSLFVSDVQTIWATANPQANVLVFTPYKSGQLPISNTSYAPYSSTICGVKVKANGAGLSRQGVMSVYSNAIGNSIKNVDITVNVIGGPNPPVISGSQLYTVPGSYTFTAPTGVTQVTVAVQGPGANGTTGEFKGPYPSPFTADAGAGGGRGGLEVQTLSVIPGNTYSVVVGDPGTASSFDVVSAASGIPAFGTSGLGNPGYGGTGDNGPVITVLANSVSISYTGIGGAGGMTSKDSSYSVPPGEGQGFSFINVGANGWSGQGPGSGGGGGGADEGYSPGIGGAGQAGYVWVFWGENAYPFYNSAPISIPYSVGGQGQRFTWT